LHETNISFNPVVFYANRLSCGPGESFGPRVNEDYQWLFVEKGEGEVLLGGVRHAAAPGCLFAYGPGIIHTITASESNPFILYGLHFMPDGQLTPLSHPAKLRIHQVDQKSAKPDGKAAAITASGDSLLPAIVRAGAWVLPYFEDLVENYARNDEWSALALRGTLSRLYVRLQRWIAERSASAPSDTIAATIRKLLEERAEEAYQMSWLEDCTGYSHDYASKIFKEKFGMPPHAYHQRMKLKAARKYLEDTRLSVTAVAERLRFGSIHYFCKWFRQMTGESPTAYRERSRII